MKKIIVLVALVAACLATPRLAEAHAIWIEADARAVKNKAHEVKIFYGEYPAGEIEPTEKWYSDLRTLEAWVISPSKKKVKLNLTDSGSYLGSSFVPLEDGIYYITTVHTTKDLGGTTKYEFSSVAPVISGKSLSPSAVPDQSLSVIVKPDTFKTENLVRLQVWKGEKEFAGGEVLIMSPEGWVKTVKADERGEISFTPKIKGSYVIETSDYKKEAGEWNAKQYTHTWKGSTTRIMVN